MDDKFSIVCADVKENFNLSISKDDFNIIIDAFSYSLSDEELIEIFGGINNTVSEASDKGFLVKKATVIDRFCKLTKNIPYEIIVDLMENDTSENCVELFTTMDDDRAHELLSILLPTYVDDEYDEDDECCDNIA